VRPVVARILLYAGASGLVLLAGAAIFPVVTGRTSAPAIARESARSAVTAARDARAMLWAPEEWAAATAALDAALLETRRNELSLVVLRDYREARDLLREAEAAGNTARQAAMANRETARASALEAVERADEVILATESLTGAVRIDPPSRRALRSAKMSLTEARELWDDEQYDEARDRADRAVGAVRAARELVATLAARYVDRDQVRQWRRWKEDTIQWSRRSGGAALLIDKNDRQLTLYVGGKAVETYRAEFGFNHLQQKIRSGDGATPEGRYRIIAKKDRGRSKYYRALEIDYPNDDDRSRFERARRRGHVPANARPGGLIEVHGDGGRGWDWTRGCVALSNRDIDRLYPRVQVGTPVTIIGSDGGQGRFSDLAQSLKAEKENGTRLD